MHHPRSMPFESTKQPFIFNKTVKEHQLNSNIYNSFDSNQLTNILALVLENIQKRYQERRHYDYDNKLECQQKISLSRQNLRKPSQAQVKYNKVQNIEQASFQPLSQKLQKIEQKLQFIQMRISSDQNMQPIQQKINKLSQNENIFTITNLPQKKLKYGGQFQNKLDSRDQVLQHFFNFQITTQMLNNAQNDTNFLSSKCYLFICSEIQKFLVQVIENVTSISFNFLVEGKLTQNQCKDYASKNILMNVNIVFRQTIKFFKQKKIITDQNQVDQDNKTINTKFFEFIDATIKQILINLTPYYPQSPPTGATPKMKEALLSIDRSDNQFMDFLMTQQLKIKQQISGDYTQYIMEVINRVINFSSQTAETDVKQSTIYQNFISFNKKLFWMAGQDQNKIPLISKNKKQQEKGWFCGKDNIQQNYSDIFNKIDQSMIKSSKTNHQHFHIGKKIPNGIKPFTKQQINDRQFTAKNSSVLRILTKWAEMLENIFDNPKDYTINRVYPFKTLSHQIVHLDRNKRKQLYQKLLNAKKNQSLIKQQLIQKNRQFEGFIFYDKQKDKNISRYIKRYTKTRVLASKMNTMLIHLMKEYVSKLIYLLVDVGKIEFKINVYKQSQEIQRQLKMYENVQKIDQKQHKSQEYKSSMYFQQDTKLRSVSKEIQDIKQSIFNPLQNKIDKQKIDTNKSRDVLIINKPKQSIQQTINKVNIDLVVFRIGDLMRSKVYCSQTQFIHLLKILYKLDQSHSQASPLFELVRIKNKLDSKDSNILINYLFLGKVQCQLQMSVQSMTKKQQNYNQFNHFLYELTRGKFGVLCQCATIIAQHDPIVSAASTQITYKPSDKRKKEKKKQQASETEKNNHHQIFKVGQNKSIKEVIDKKNQQMNNMKNEIINKISKISFSCKQCDDIMINKQLFNVFSKQMCQSCFLKQHLGKLDMEQQMQMKIFGKTFGSIMAKNRKNNLLSRINNFGQFKLQNKFQIEDKDNQIVIINQQRCQLQYSLIGFQESSESFYSVKLTNKLLEKQKLAQSDIQYQNITEFVKKQKQFTQFTYFARLQTQTLDKIIFHPLRSVQKILTLEQKLNMQLKFNNIHKLVHHLIIKKDILSTIKNKNQALVLNNKLKFSMIKQLIQSQQNNINWFQDRFSTIQLLIAESIDIDIVPSWIKKLARLKFLNLSQNNIKDISSVIKYCNELQQLIITSNQIQQIDWKQFQKYGPHLKVFNFNHNQIKQVILNNFLVLSSINIIEIDQEFSLKQIRLTNCFIITIFSFQGLYNSSSLLKNISLQNCPQLKFIDVNQAPYLENFSLGICHFLQKLHLPDHYQLSQDIVQQWPCLQSLNVSFAQKQLHLRKWPLQQLQLKNNNNLQVLQIQGFPFLQKLSLKQNVNLWKVQFTQKPTLKKLQFINNYSLQTIDIIKLQNLQQVIISQNSSLQIINLKQLQSLGGLTIKSNPNLSVLCYTNLPKLKLLQLFDNSLLKRQINFQNLIGLKTLIIDQCQFEQLDICMLQKLQFLTVKNNQMLNKINFIYPQPCQFVSKLLKVSIINNISLQTIQFGIMPRVEQILIKLNYRLKHLSFQSKPNQLKIFTVQSNYFMPNGNIHQIDRFIKIQPIEEQI